jgi:hypothetical protein
MHYNQFIKERKQQKYDEAFNNCQKLKTDIKHIMNNLSSETKWKFQMRTITQNCIDEIRKESKYDIIDSLHTYDIDNTRSIIHNNIMLSLRNVDNRKYFEIYSQQNYR